MKRFSEFSASERCIFLCSLGSFIEERERMIAENLDSPDCKCWAVQAHKAAQLRNDLVMECYKKIRSA